MLLLFGLIFLAYFFDFYDRLPRRLDYLIEHFDNLFSDKGHGPGEHIYIIR
jgi:hypothetical protein